ncbi:MAG: hypothetical protein HYS83_01050 [Candidatus Blackburnbacteria bacterium]|nr:hypothetical protein [Candidatus Blackburnbacteria bacterium]
MKFREKLAIKRVNIPHPQFLSLVYHDLFSYPLTKSELKTWEIGAGDRPRYEVFCLGSFFCLAGRSETILRRIANSREAPRKLKIARKAARVLSILPTVKLVGVSGGLAMENAKRNDDIDLFIITSGGALWITRLLSFLVLRLAKLRVRRFGDEDVRDKLCLNLWVDENNISFSQRRDIYTAHEVAQTKVLFERDGIYGKFVKANKWAGEFFPNALKNSAQRIVHSARVASWLDGSIVGFLRLFEKQAYLFQKLYMAGKITAERAEPGRALFHPVLWGNDVPHMFLRRLELILQGRNKGFPFYSRVTD